MAEIVAAAAKQEEDGDEHQLSECTPDHILSELHFDEVNRSASSPEDLAGEAINEDDSFFDDKRVLAFLRLAAAHCSEVVDE